MIADRIYAWLAANYPGFEILDSYSPRVLNNIVTPNYKRELIVFNETSARALGQQTIYTKDSQDDGVKTVEVIFEGNITISFFGESRHIFAQFLETEARDNARKYGFGYSQNISFTDVPIPVASQYIERLLLDILIRFSIPYTKNNQDYIESCNFETTFTN